MTKLIPGTILQSNNYGYFRIISDDGALSVRVEFEDTGYTAIVSRYRANKGEIKDVLRPSVYGVGFVGEGGYHQSVNGISVKAYDVWISMLSRCYSEKAKHLNPSYFGCTVIDEWHNFQNYAKWHEINYKPGLHLDKDIKIPGNSVYGPNTCVFVTQKENNIKAAAKNYELRSPLGVKHKIYNLSSFARDNDLYPGHLSAVYSGTRRHHKGWTKA